MDALAWVTLAVALGGAVVLIARAPAMHRERLRRQMEGTAGGALSGVGAGFDAVWRPSAEEAHAQWESQTELPAPAPTPGDGGRIDDDRIVIDV